MRSRSIAIALGAGLCLALLVPATADAGSVFLKNGYIIQGKIVERGDGVVVLGWNNGQVTIHDRFIDEVLLDPSEEEMIRQQRTMALAAEQDGFDQVVAIPETPVLDLPDSYDSIMSRVRSGATTDPLDPVITSGVGTTTDPVGPVTGGTSDPAGGTANGGETGVEEVPRNEFSEKIFAAMGLAIEVPTDWMVVESANSVTVGHESDPEGVRLTVDLWRGKGVDTESAADALAARLAANYSNLAMTQAADRTIARKPAKTLACSDPATGVRSLQQVITSDLGVFVFGSFVPQGTDAETVAAMQSMLDSVRLLTE